MFRRSLGFLALVVLAFVALPSHADNFKACSNNEIQDPERSSWVGSLLSDLQAGIRRYRSGLL